MKLRYERGALADLDEIFAYIAADNPAAAARLVDRIEDAARRIAATPYMERRHASPDSGVSRLATIWSSMRSGRVKWLFTTCATAHASDSGRESSGQGRQADGCAAQHGAGTMHGESDAGDRYAAQMHHPTNRRRAGLRGRKKRADAGVQHRLADREEFPRVADAELEAGRLAARQPTHLGDE